MSKNEAQPNTESPNHDENNRTAADAIVVARTLLERTTGTDHVSIDETKDLLPVAEETWEHDDAVASQTTTTEEDATCPSHVDTQGTIRDPMSNGVVAREAITESITEPPDERSPRQEQGVRGDAGRFHSAGGLIC